MNKLIRFTAFYTVLALSLSNVVFADEKLPVEGIVYESKDSSRSFVSIGGQFYPKGAKYQGYEIIEVKKDRIIYKDEKGKISEQRIKVGVSPASGASPASASSGSEGTNNTDPTAAVWEQLKKIFGFEGGTFDPAAILRYANETAVMADMRKLYTAANMAYMESDGSSVSVDKLIQDGLLSPAFKEGKNNYDYRVESMSKGVQVYASPVNGNSKSRHFMIDSFGDMRFEVGRPATSSSPLLKLPGAESFAPTPRHEMPKEYGPQE